MGNSDCKSCNFAQFFEKKIEFDLLSVFEHGKGSQGQGRNSDIKAKSGALKKPSGSIVSVQDIGEFDSSYDYSSLKPHILKLEALWLGYTTRKLVSHLKLQADPNHKYFSNEEIYETLSKKVGVPNYRQKKKAYKYKTGAVYTGHWRGGFRDGSGIMEWSDGSKYKGNWSYGKPWGLGTFTHADGEVYEGQWKYTCFSIGQILKSSEKIKLRGSSDGYCKILCRLALEQTQKN